ncbi:hypothetical protein ACEQ8H_006647 [Pleosporales sp. CAS-2024a]
MAATTRARTAQAIENALTPNKKPTKTTANTSKPRTTTTTSTTTTTTTKSRGRPAGVTKAKKPRTKTEKVIDKIVGSGEKVVGDIEGKPGKKAAGTRKARGTDHMVAKKAPKTKKAVV